MLRPGQIVHLKYGLYINETERVAGPGEDLKILYFEGPADVMVQVIDFQEERKKIVPVHKIEDVMCRLTDEERRLRAEN